MLTQSLGSVLKAAGVHYEAQASFKGRPGLTRLQAAIRYLNPRPYVGFGDPVYSFRMILIVGDLAALQGTAQPAGTARRFEVNWADIHSESRAGQPFEPVVLEWGRSRLVVTWRRDNPTLDERVTQQGPLMLGLLGLDGGRCSRARGCR